MATTTGTPAAPRLRMESCGSRRSLLDGAWWPRSTDPVAELPGLVLAIDTVCGPVTRLVLGADGWDTHPQRLDVAGRVLHVAYFASQPVSLLTAICDNGDRVDLLVVPTGTADDAADAAMILAATTDSLVQAQHILRAVGASATGVAETRWEGEGGNLGVPADGRFAPSWRRAVR